MEEKNLPDSQLLKKLQALRKKMVGIDRIRIGQKRTQDALYEILELYQTLVDISPDAVVLLDLQGRVIMVNDHALQLHGYAGPDEVIGKDVFEFFIEQDRERGRKDFYRIIKDGSILREEYTLLKKDSSTLFADVTASIIQDKDGYPLAVISISRDISERKQMENKLSSNESMFRAVIEATIDGILVVDGKGKVCHYNARFADMWQIPEALLDMQDDEKLLEYVLDQLADPDAFVAKVHNLYKSREEDREIIYFKNGRVFERYSAPLLQNNEISGRVWSFRDISDRRSKSGVKQE
ncbi:MAG: PAS domain S-box protein [PVC group bacterium]|nr:PAS domain S-box protein [PVC group bacterium]